MATDRYPDEEGSIVDGFICGLCYADNAVNAGEIVTWGTSASGRLAVTPALVYGDGIGVVLKAAAATGDIIPVAFSGIVKMVVSDILAIGTLVINEGSLALYTKSAAVSSAIFAGTQTIMGCMMQASAAAGDECLILLGGDGLSSGII